MQQKLMNNTYAPAASLTAQQKYCSSAKKPNFVPPDGFCLTCRRNIFEEGGYTYGMAAHSLITYCPFCNTTFCD